MALDNLSGAIFIISYTLPDIQGDIDVRKICFDFD
jgi:hypothetical protein